MITIGVDAHKGVHVAVALDEAGRPLKEWRGSNSRAGWEDALKWATSVGPVRQWGVEGAWGYGRGLAQHLVMSGEVVHEVNARLTAQTRRRARQIDKTDNKDANAVAQCVRQQEDNLPLIKVEDETAVMELLTVERNAALAEATRLRNQIHALLLQLDPEYRNKIGNLKSRSAIAALLDYGAPDSSLVQIERAAVIRRLAERLQLALKQAGEVAEHIRNYASKHAEPLTRLCGISLLTAGALAGILGPGQRFQTDAQMAAYAGVSPVEASSAGRVRHRLNRGGNRRLNAILYRIVLTQSGHSPQARAYLDRRVSEGKTRREAFRALKRFRLM